MSTTLFRKTDALQSAMIESLEPRQLLSGYVLDTSFGNGGVYTGPAVYSNGVGIITHAASVRADGSIVFDDETTKLYPDGTPGTINGPLAPPAVPTPPQPTNKQADGKYLALTPISRGPGLYTSLITRFNKNGTIDTTFGVKGSISDYTALTGDPSFLPTKVIVVANRIYLIGYTLHTTSAGAADGQIPKLGILGLKLDGSLDPAFGFFTIADHPDTLSNGDFAGLGADGTLYLTGIEAEGSKLGQTFWVVSPTGKELLSPFNADDLSKDFADGPHYAPGGIAAFLVQGSGPDAYLYGSAGSARIIPPGQPGEASIAGVGADGRIFVNYTSQYNYVLCYRPVIDNTGAVSGHFFNDVNADHKVDKTETGLAGWQAYADINNSGIFDFGEPTAYTDVLGNYTIHNLAPGNYRIREVRQNNWTRTTPAGDWLTGGVYTVTIAANKIVSGLNFGNSDTRHGASSIAGTIFNDVNGNEIQDAGEPGLVGWQVYADFNNNGVYDAGEAIATTGKNGNYKFTNLPQGGYRLREMRQSGWVRTSPRGDWPLGYIDVVISTGQNLGGKNFGNALGNSILAAVAGRVFNDVNGNGKLDAGEKPAAGVIVDLLDDLENIIRETITKNDGSYSFTNLDPAVLYHIFVHTNAAIPIRVSSPKNNLTPSLRPSQVIQVDFFVQSMARFGVAAYNDVNGDARIEAGDGPGYSGQVYLDLNDDGTRDSNEPVFNVGYEQSFTDWVAPGTYYVRLVPEAGWSQTYPSHNAAMIITLAVGQTINGLIFTVHQTL